MSVAVIKADGKVCVASAQSYSAATRNIVIFIPSLRVTAPSIVRTLCIEALDDVAVIRMHKVSKRKNVFAESVKVVCLKNDIEVEEEFADRDEMRKWLAKALRWCGFSETDAELYATEISSNAPSEVKPFG